MRLARHAIALAFAFLIFSPAGLGKAPARAYTVPGVFDREAGDSTTAGIGRYSKDLIELIVPRQAGPRYINHLSERLAKAEQNARAGKGGLVTEATVVTAFNRIMKEIGTMPSLQATDVDLHDFRARAASASAFPALLSAGRNNTKCNPGEAIFLVYLLISNNGQISGSTLDQTAKLERFDSMAAGPQARTTGRLTTDLATLGQGTEEAIISYSARRGPHATHALFNELARAFGI